MITSNELTFWVKNRKKIYYLENLNCSKIIIGEFHEKRSKETSSYVCTDEQTRSRIKVFSYSTLCAVKKYLRCLYDKFTDFKENILVFSGKRYFGGGGK